MSKILILVMSSKVLENRIDGILNSYYNTIKNYNNIDLIFYSDHEDISKKVIKLDCTFAYNYSDNEIKNLTAFNLIKNNYYNKYDWFLFIDDDTFVNIPLLNDKLSLFDENYVYGKEMTGYYGDLKYVSGGAGYIISNKIIHKLFDPINYKTTFADVSVGMNMRERGLEFINSDYFDPFNWYRNGTPEKFNNDIENKITYHYINPSQMLELMKYIK